MLRIFKTSQEVLHAAADYFVEVARKSISDRNRFTVSLAGGSSPKGLYELLASPAYNSQVEWNKVFFSLVTNVMFLQMTRRVML